MTNLLISGLTVLTGVLFIGFGHIYTGVMFVIVGCFIAYDYCNNKEKEKPDFKTGMIYENIISKELESKEGRVFVAFVKIRHDNVVKSYKMKRDIPKGIFTLNNLGDFIILEEKGMIIK